MRCYIFLGAWIAPYAPTLHADASVDWARASAIVAMSLIRSSRWFAATSSLECPSAPLDTDVAATPADLTVLGDICLPDGFVELIRRSQPHTPWHIPETLRLRILKESTKYLNGMASGLPGW